MSLSFRVGHEEYLGAERIVYGNLEGTPFDGKKAVSRMSATYSGKYDSGSLQAFAVSERHLRFFDRKSGKRTDSRPDRWR